MKIFQFAADFERFKFLTFALDSPESKRVRAFRGQPLSSDWSALHMVLFHGKTKAERARSDDFDVSCFDPRLLLCRQSAALAIERVAPGKVELLPIETDIGPFSFVNVTHTVPAVDLRGLDEEQEMEMLRCGNIRFDASVVRGETIFRDAAIHEVFVTETFISELTGVSLRGARFEQVGKVT